jgi:flagellar hook-associated protein 1 FlgK
MSLALALNNALSGLRVNQQSINVLSQNIANVNTSGYSRQILSQSAVNVEGLGSGVKIDEITRKIDLYLQRSVQTQGANNASSQTVSDYYDRIQALLGQPGAGNSIDSFLTSFFNSVQKLAETPEVTSLKSNAISSASALAKQLSDLAANVFDLRFEADRELGDAVTTVNGALERLENLNKALTQAKSLGQSATGLLDGRDKELRTISEYMNIATTFNDSGAVTVAGGDGIVILEEGVIHRLRYSKAQSSENFIQNQPLNPLEVITINESGQEIGRPSTLLSGGTSAEVESNVFSGKIEALRLMRDVKFVEVNDQLDQLASKLRDATNAIHNNGSGFPPATSLTGDRAIRPSDQYSWEGLVRIAVLQTNGKPVASSYADEAYTGIRPLTMDLSRLNSGQGNGKPTMQTIVDEINNHFGPPGNKAKLGNLNNIQLASDTNLLPSGGSALFNFDLDLENISDKNARVFVTGITVKDDLAVNITNVTQTAPSISIQPTGSYTTTAGSSAVTINLATAPSLSPGDTIYLNAPSGPVNGIGVGSLTGFFKVTAVAGNLVTFTSGGVAAATGSVNDAGNIQMFQPYQTVAGGIKDRTRDSGELQVDLTANVTSLFYNITVNVTVIGEDNVIRTAPITYRVNNNERDIYNKRYDAIAAGGAGTLVLPSNSQGSMRAILVDASGRELPTVNGKYVDSESYLKIIGGNTGETYSVAIDELSSKQLGLPDGSPAELGTNRGFSHYFGLNNLFASNSLNNTGDDVHNSAINLKVQDRFINNANLISTGNLVKLSKSIDSNNLEIYTYARNSGDNASAQKLAKLNSQVIAFDAAGGLPQTQLSLQSYTSEVIGFISQRSSEATENASNNKTLFEGFKNRADAISGVNLDEELANTVVFQNAYSATARVITVVNKMYDDLLQSF